MHESMRAAGPVPIAALAALFGVCGCTNTTSTEARQVHAVASSLAPAPKNPDLTDVMERFYQQVEGGHWAIAYGMLSARYRARLTQQQLADRYAVLSDPSVHARQRSDRMVVAWIDAGDRQNSGRAVHIREAVTLAWDGEQWTIDAIERRGVSSGDTR